MDIQGNDIDQRLIDYSEGYRDYRNISITGSKVCNCTCKDYSTNSSYHDKHTHSNYRNTELNEFTSKDRER